MVTCWLQVLCAIIRAIECAWSGCSMLQWLFTAVGDCSEGVSNNIDVCGREELATSKKRWPSRRCLWRAVNSPPTKYERVHVVAHCCDRGQKNSPDSSIIAKEDFHVPVGPSKVMVALCRIRVVVVVVLYLEVDSLASLLAWSAFALSVHTLQNVTFF